MAPSIGAMSAYLDPALCANPCGQGGAIELCANNAVNACSGCQIVQYCSKECQKKHWPLHKVTCKSELMKTSWKPEWHRNHRIPVFISDRTPLAMFGTKKYLWGNMPALDILNLKDNEGDTDLNRDLALLFAASGDPRNIFKTVAGLPIGCKSRCHVTVNDMDFDIVARNAIMLLIALHYEPEEAVPMIIHFWYSALLPAMMVQSLQANVLPLIEDVCGKIASKASDALQAKTFTIRGRTLRLVLKKQEWLRLGTYFDVPEGLSAGDADSLRREVTLAPSRVDYRDRAMLNWTPTLRQCEERFRMTGILLPYGCSQGPDFDTPNPLRRLTKHRTFFQEKDWPMMDSACPREGWDCAEYTKHAPIAKADTYGALFFMLRDLLLRFCERVHKVKISFELFCINAVNIGNHTGTRRFDRIEISNICDRGYIGPQACFMAFSPLLKDKSANSKASMLMLFLNAVKEIDHTSSDTVSKQLRMSMAMNRTRKYLPIHKYTPPTSYGDPDLIRRTSCLDALTDYSGVFETFLRDELIAEGARANGLKIKDKHTIVEPWPYKVGMRATKKEFDILVAGSTSGYERYMEVEKL
ncbi:uncharacterized protein M421DRAFT_61946 [Didymella exigua CBS 183.55]|uniref:MYND-type domain-containing protein n=1 Tax=Didymella exigua CBS 183.55 TaxID=1150837 RepID=A0A6A5RNX1_9PLEO|nr:uncharacterized protein M421DRAFT_61946 [Didymella exigua CBS 183.55]KAF1928848.1 hypothetical protein M421DRAFT_61946 [Didymella exigua CBS 183.55]